MIGRAPAERLVVYKGLKTEIIKPREGVATVVTGTG